MVFAIQPAENRRAISELFVNTLAVLIYFIIQLEDRSAATE